VKHWALCGGVMHWNKALDLSLVPVNSQVKRCGKHENRYLRIGCPEEDAKRWICEWYSLNLKYPQKVLFVWGHIEVETAGH
jgi:hypothetical protein